MFGSKSTIKKDSFLQYTFDIILSVMRNEFNFDNILIDTLKISDEKFIVENVILILIF